MISIEHDYKPMSGFTDSLWKTKLDSNLTIMIHLFDAYIYVRDQVYYFNLTVGKIVQPHNYEVGQLI